jgi:glycosyltransferase involved in cell wall biosynthesis
MPFIYWHSRLDLLHIPYFSIPVLYPRKYIITLHDLTVLHVDTGRASTLPGPLYRLKKAGFRMVMSVGLNSAKSIIAVSQATKSEIIDHFHISADKISVTYEGVDRNIDGSSGRNTEPVIPKPYFLYVGNAYPHKNLEMLLTAFKQFQYRIGRKFRLVLVGRHDIFYQRLVNLAGTLEVSDRVTFFGEANDMQLANLYSHATAFIFPSLMEGFGLPALEAAACGCPLILSDIPVFHELVGTRAIYFDPRSSDGLTDLLVRFVSQKVSGKSESGSIDPRFNWEKLARDTLKIYENCAGL